MTDSRVMSMTVIVSVMFAMMVLLVAAGMGGEYVLSLHILHNAEAAQAAGRAREATAQLRSSVPTCHALQALDNAKNGATFPHYPGAKPGQGYGQRLAAAIHQVYASTRCQVLLSGLAHHMSLSAILKQLGEGS